MYVISTHRINIFYPSNISARIYLSLSTSSRYFRWTSTDKRPGNYTKRIGTACLSRNAVSSGEIDIIFLETGASRLTLSIQNFSTRESRAIAHDGDRGMQISISVRSVVAGVPIPGGVLEFQGGDIAAAVRSRVPRGVTMGEQERVSS